MQMDSFIQASHHWATATDLGVARMKQAKDYEGVLDSLSAGRVFVGRAFGMAGGAVALALLLHLAGCGR